MYDVIVFDTRDKQTITHSNLEIHDTNELVNICLKSYYLNCYVVNFHNEKVSGIDFICGLERG